MLQVAFSCDNDVFGGKLCYTSSGTFYSSLSPSGTTIVDVQSPLPPLEVLNGVSFWLEERGWKNNGGDIKEKLLVFNGSVASSTFLTIFLSCLGGLGSACLGLVLIQLYPFLSWWPLLLAFGR